MALNTNVNGERLYDWMAVLDCKHVEELSPAPLSVEGAILRMKGTTQRCEPCGTQQTIVYVGLWDWNEWEQLRDERWHAEHLRSLAHVKGWCLCGEPAESWAVSPRG